MLTTSYSFTNDPAQTAAVSSAATTRLTAIRTTSTRTRSSRSSTRSVWQNASQPTGYEIPIVLSGNSE